MKRKIQLFIASIAVILLPCLSTAASNMTDKQQGVTEVVLFTTSPNYTPQQIMTLANNITPVLTTYPGFISRHISEDVKNPHHWIDIVEWQSLHDATSAAHNIMGTPQMQAFSGTMEHYTMYHFKGNASS